MQFESVVLKNGCTTNINLGSGIFKKEKIAEFNGRQFQLTKGIGEKAIGVVSTYVIENNKKVKISIWWTKNTELFDSIQYFNELDSRHMCKHITTMPKKYADIKQEIVDIIDKTNYLFKI